MPFGLPLRTMKTIAEVYGEALFGNFFVQSLATSPLSARNSMSFAWFIVTTSASRPSATARTCFDEPPCDCFTSTASPVFCFQYFWNIGL